MNSGGVRDSLSILCTSVKKLSMRERTTCKSFSYFFLLFYSIITTAATTFFFNCLILISFLCFSPQTSRDNTEPLSHNKKTGKIQCSTAAAKSLQLCPTLCDPIPGILQARTVGWVVISFSNA